MLVDFAASALLEVTGEPTAFVSFVAGAVACPNTWEQQARSSSPKLNTFCISIYRVVLAISYSLRETSFRVSPESKTLWASVISEEKSGSSNRPQLLKKKT
jgi:hypothetical protein